MMQSQRSALLRELTHNQTMLARNGGDPFFDLAYTSKISSIEQKLSELEASEAKSPFVSLTFTGDAVRGSYGMSAEFAATTMRAFQKTVAICVAEVRETVTAIKGVVRGSNHSQFEFMGVALGSFGYELSKAEPEDLIVGQELTAAIDTVVDYFKLGVTGGAVLQERLANASPRLLSQIKAFLVAVKREGGTVQFTTAQRESRLEADEVVLAFEHFDRVVKDVEVVRLQGVFKGAMTGSHTFEFLPPGETALIKGKVDPELTDAQLAAYDQQFIEMVVEAELEKSETTTHLTGAVKVEWVLMGVKEFIESTDHDR